MSETPEMIRVLVFQSEKQDRDLIEKLLSGLENPSFELEFADSLAQGLQKLPAWRGDLIFTDLLLSDARGLEIFEKIKKTAARTPIIALSRSQDEREALDAVAMGAEDYLVKSTLNRTMLPRVFRYAIERHKSHEAIYIAEEKYRTIFENSAVAITLVDYNEKIISWNGYTEMMLGMGKDQLFKKHVGELYPPEEWQKIRKRSIRKKGFQSQFETKMVKGSGERIDVEISISVLKDEAGQVKGSIGIMQDITERKRLESVKDEFLSTVSHEMRTPMTIIREGVSQLLDGILGDPTPDQKEVLELTLESIDRLARIINDLLDISKLDAGKMDIRNENVDLIKVAQNMQATFGSIVKDKGLEIALSIPDGPLCVEGDRGRIIQVLTNLIGNALKFTPKGRITLGFVDEGDSVVCSVSDTGKGIAEEDLPYVFEKFRQFGREEGPGDKGTGLGLAICQKIVALHNGKIGVESKLDKGTKFTFTLPKKRPAGNN